MVLIMNKDSKKSDLDNFLKKVEKKKKVKVLTLKSF